MDILQVVERVKNGDEAAFCQVMEHYERKIFMTARQMVRNTATAEDLVQDIFIKVYYSIHKFETTGSFNAWLYRLAVNQCLDYMRKQRSKEVPVEEIIERQHPERIVLEREKHDALEQLLQTLEQTEYLVLLLRYVNELRYDEISEVLQMPLNEVRNKLHRSKKKLRQVATVKGGYFYEL